MPRIVKFIESESALVDARGQLGDGVLGTGDWELVFYGDRFSVKEGEKLGKWMMLSCTTTYLVLLSCRVKHS